MDKHRTVLYTVLSDDRFIVDTFLPNVFYTPRIQSYVMTRDSSWRFLSALASNIWEIGSGAGGGRYGATAHVWWCHSTSGDSATARLVVAPQLTSGGATARRVIVPQLMSIVGATPHLMSFVGCGATTLVWRHSSCLLLAVAPQLWRGATARLLVVL